MTPFEEEGFEAALLPEAAPVGAELVGTAPDSSDWRLVSSECTPDTRAEAALPIPAPPPDLAPDVAFELAFEGQPVDGGGGAVACDGSAPASMSVRSEDGALDPAVAVLVCAPAWACICCQWAWWPPDTAELDMVASTI